MQQYEDRLDAVHAAELVRRWTMGQLDAELTACTTDQARERLLAAYERTLWPEPEGGPPTAIHHA